MDDDPKFPCRKCEENTPGSELVDDLCPVCADADAECDCADRVPADLTPDDVWICPKCDAQWFGEDDDYPTEAVLAPREPTEEMQARGRDALEPFVGVLKQPVADQWQLARLVYAAMIAPSPAPDLEGLRERVARCLFDRGRTVHDFASWEAADDETRNWVRGHADAILSLIFTPEGEGRE